MTLAAALEITRADARAKGKDDLLKRLYRMQREESTKTREDATQVSVFLKRALKSMTQSMEQAAKRRKEKQEEDRLAANEAEERKRATARAQQEVAEAARALLEQQMANRLDLDKCRVAAARAKNVRRWLQTEYTANLAAAMIR